MDKTISDDVIMVITYGIIIVNRIISHEFNCDMIRTKSRNLNLRCASAAVTAFPPDAMERGKERDRDRDRDRDRETDRQTDR